MVVLIIICLDICSKAWGKSLNNPYEMQHKLDNTAFVIASLSMEFCQEHHDSQATVLCAKWWQYLVTNMDGIHPAFTWFTQDTV